MSLVHLFTSLVFGCCVPIAGIVTAGSCFQILQILQCMFTVRQHTSSDPCKCVVVERKHVVRMHHVKWLELMHTSGRTGM